MWGGWGIYSPNHQNMVVGRLLSHGAPDSPVRQPRQPARWGSTVGALIGGASWLSGGVPDRSRDGNGPRSPIPRGEFLH
jgi:hypothetical protein